MKYIALFVLTIISSIVYSDNESDFIKTNNFPNMSSEEHGIKFQGSAVVKGRFVFEWEVRDNELQWIEASFYPDEVFEKIFSIHKYHLPADSAISLANAEERVFDFLSKEDADKLISGKLLKAYGKAILKITEYIHVIDCNQRSYVTNKFDVLKTSEREWENEISAKSGC